jgi:O-antigen/teichoic acid export membrane protein
MAMASKTLNTLILGSLLRRNVLANYLGSAVSILGPLISMPFYLAFLGSERFGLISFILLVQAFLNLLDLGLGQALIREISLSLSSPDGERHTTRLVFNLERLYWGFALVVTILLCLTSNLFASHWLKLGSLHPYLGIFSVCGAALIFLFQFPGALYRSFLIGSQSQVQFNKILIVANIFRHLGGVIVVYLYPSLATYLAWQISVTLAETLVRRLKVWALLGDTGQRDRWNIKEFNYFYRLTRGLSIAIWIGAFFVQLDKLILSKMVSIEEFGYYSIASSISLGVLQLIYPILQAVQPKAVTLKDNVVLLGQLYRKLFTTIFLVFTVVILVFVLGGYSILSLWLRHPDAVSHVHEYCSFLLIGTAFNALYNVGYMDWIVHRKVRSILTLNLFSLTLMLTLLPVAIKAFGVKGATVGWVIVNFISFCCTLGWLVRKES